MAVFYAVEFPLEDAKSRGPYIVPENKIKVEDGSTRILWSVVDEQNGDLKECSDFVDRLKKSWQEAEISNKGGVRNCKKPSKLDDYDFPATECLDDLDSGKPPAKKLRKALESGLFSNSDPEDELEPFDPEMEGNAVLNKWTKRALSASEKKANGSSRQNRWGETTIRKFCPLGEKKQKAKSNENRTKSRGG